MFVVGDPKSMKKAYSAPSFEVQSVETAKAALEEKGASNDPQIEEMLVVINQRLDEKASASGSSVPHRRVP